MSVGIYERIPDRFSEGILKRHVKDIMETFMKKFLEEYVKDTLEAFSDKPLKKFPCQIL